MKISTKSRYALAALIILAEEKNTNKNITTVTIAEKLDISKLYLEQIFSQLKRGKFVKSEKGFQGGYRLAKSLPDISVGDIMRLFEQQLFSKIEPSFSENASYIDQALEKEIWAPLDEKIIQTLDAVHLADLLKEAEQNKNGYMYYI